MLTPLRRVPWLAATVAAGVAAGIALRGWVLALPGTGAVDSDEAVVGLMARHALHGEVSAFFWGQAYGGSLEALLAVPVFAVAGSSALTLKLVPITLSAVAALLVWRLGRRTVGPAPGAVAGVAMWVWPANMVWFSTKERGFYWVGLVLGLAFLLLACRLADDARARQWWLVLGLVGGVAWWTTPQSLYFVVPGLLWLVARARREAWRVVLAVPTAVLGALPWLAFNAGNDWRSLDATNRTNDEGILGNLGVLAQEGVPVILGLHATQRWLVDGLFPALYVAVVLALVVGVVRRRAGTGLLVLAIATYPLLYSAFPVSGVVGEGRYVLFLLPFLALLLVHAVPNAGGRVLLLGALVALSVATVPRIDGRTAPYARDVTVPDDLDPLLAGLRARDVDHVIADYWIAYRIAFESDERIAAAPMTDSRYPPFDRAVVASPRPAWVFVAGTALTEQFEVELARRRATAEVFRAGAFVVYRPDQRVVCWPPPPVVGVPCG